MCVGWIRGLWLFMRQTGRECRTLDDWVRCGWRIIKLLFSCPLFPGKRGFRCGGVVVVC